LFLLRYLFISAAKVRIKCGFASKAILMKLKTCINEPCDACRVNTYALRAVFSRMPFFLDVLFCFAGNGGVGGGVKTLTFWGSLQWAVCGIR
jgi:hypothetical protein